MCIYVFKKALELNCAETLADRNQTENYSLFKDIYFNSISYTALLTVSLK